MCIADGASSADTHEFVFACRKTGFDFINIILKILKKSYRCINVYQSSNLQIEREKVRVCVCVHAREGERAGEVPSNSILCRRSRRRWCRTVWHRCKAWALNFQISKNADKWCCTYDYYDIIQTSVRVSFSLLIISKTKQQKQIFEL